MFVLLKCTLLQQRDSAQQQTSHVPHLSSGCQGQCSAAGISCFTSKFLLFECMLLQDRDSAQQQAAEAVGMLEGSQADTLTLSQALGTAQAALEERAAAYDAQLADMQETLAQAEEAISNTNAALVAAQVTLVSLPHPNQGNQRGFGCGSGVRLIPSTLRPCLALMPTKTIGSQLLLCGEDWRRARC